MPWTFDDSAPERANELGRNIPVPAAGMRNYYAWRREINLHSKAPKTAAEAVGDLNYKKLRGGGNVYEIRLTQRHRALFEVDDATRTVKVLQIGGHT